MNRVGGEKSKRLLLQISCMTVKICYKRKSRSRAIRPSEMLGFASAARRESAALLQVSPFCRATRLLLRCKSGRFVLQEGLCCRAKGAYLVAGMGVFGIILLHTRAFSARISLWHRGLAAARPKLPENPAKDSVVRSLGSFERWRHANIVTGVGRRVQTECTKKQKNRVKTLLVSNILSNFADIM